ncbi:MAG: hypothetical protein J7M21_03640, partial [Planctomycetes bacterium]|nr:hypothetical protein [Planctomycetota bacterium]
MSKPGAVLSTIILAVIASAVPSRADWARQRLLPPAGDANDFFGYSAAIDGDLLVVGAHQGPPMGQGPGYVSVFRHEPGRWAHEATLRAPNAVPGSYFGWSVDISGDTIVVGALSDQTRSGPSGPGSAYVFERSGGLWQPAAKLTPDDGQQSDFFGTAVAIDGDRIVVGAAGEGPDDTGSAYVFQRQAGQWTRQVTLHGSDSGAYDYFGSSVGISGSTVVVGAPQHSDEYPHAGAAYVFDETPTGWTERAKLVSTQPQESGRFGDAVAIDGGWIAVGAPSEAGEGGASGAVYAFARDGNDWTCRQRLLAPQQGGSDPPANFGDSVAIDGDALAARATGRADHGTVNLFGRQADGSWLAEAVLAAGNGRFGFAVDIDNGSILAGAPTDGAMGEQSGAAFLFDTAHPGDADHDGDVDESDAQAVRLHFEMPGWASW